MLGNLYVLLSAIATVSHSFAAAPGRFNARLEKAYQADLAGEKVRVFTQTYLLCIALYLGFGVLDVWALPSTYHIAWIIRVVVVAGTGIVCLLARHRPDIFTRHYTLISCSIYFCWGIGIELMIMQSQPTDIASSAYYAGLILVSMALYTWTYLRPLYAGIVGLAIALCYIEIALVHQQMGGGDRWLVLLANCFFLIAANIVGMYSSYTRERFSRQTFLLKRRLRHDLIREEKAKREKEHQSEHDALTGLPNRLRLLRKLDEMIEAANGSGAVAVLFLDLDGFKPVNDMYGHAAGDHVLRCIAQRLRGAIRSTDVVARIGGDEFVVALALAERGGRTVERVMAELEEAIGRPVAHDGCLLSVGASIGCAEYPGSAGSAAELLAIADQSMYDTKRARRRAAPRAAA